MKIKTVPAMVDVKVGISVISSSLQREVQVASGPCVELQSRSKYLKTESNNTQRT